MHVTWESDFSRTCSLHRIIAIKAITVHYLNPKNLHISRLNAFFEHYLPNEIFPRKFSFVNFLLLETLTLWEISEQFHKLFQEKKALLTYWLIQWRWWFHMTPFHLKVGPLMINIHFQKHLIPKRHTFLQKLFLWFVNYLFLKSKLFKVKKNNFS